MEQFNSNQSVKSHADQFNHQTSDLHSNDQEPTTSTGTINNDKRLSQLAALTARRELAKSKATTAKPSEYYLPNIEQQPTTSSNALLSSIDEQKRQARLETRRLADRAKRLAETPSERADRLSARRLSMRKNRLTETNSDRNFRLDAKRIRYAQIIEHETESERNSCLDAKHVAYARSVKHETEAERVHRLSEQRHSTTERRHAETDLQVRARLSNQQNISRRNRTSRGATHFMGRNIPDVFSGRQIVEYDDCGPLFDDHGIPRITCKHCHAMKWKSESPQMCCANGQIALTPFPEPPTSPHTLFTEQTVDGKVFRQYSRQLNNALSLACLRVKTPSVPGRSWTPSVTIQGKVFIGMGPLQSSDGSPPVFSQLYVLDPAHSGKEQELRYNSMCLPASTPKHHQLRLKNILESLQAELRQHNPYVQDVKHACEQMENDNSTSLILSIDENKRPDGEHARRCNQGFKEVSVVFDDEHPGKRAFVISLRGPGRHVVEVPDTNRGADPLHFILLFPLGTDGWHLKMKRNARTEANVPPLMFYAFHMQVRYQPGIVTANALFRACRLFQEYCCIAFAKVENQRLKWIIHNQKTLRGESYARLCENFHNHDHENGQTLRAGQPVILAPSFPGGPRFMHSHFQDAMAITREFHKPDIFITVTCNPNWPEIRNSLLTGQQPQDRPDIVTRVFHMKLKRLEKELYQGHIFGRRAGHVRVIEFQKRGLPHAHILLILVEDDRLRTADDVY